MKLNCQLSLLRRLQPGCNGKYCQATLALCKKPEQSKTKNSDDLFLMVSTVQKMSWMKYKIKNNLQVFSKFAHEGKCTIRISEPPHDILVKNADVIQLKGFLSILHLSIQGRNLEDIHFSQPPTRVEAVKTKMAIWSRKEYPTHGFPITLVSLKISDIRLCVVPNSVLNLINLESLDLSNNLINEPNISLSPLKNLLTLILARNKLKKLSSFHIDTLPKLKLLDVSRNELTVLPDSLCVCQAITDLNLSSNQLKELPKKIGLMVRLRNLDASHNSLTALPGSIINLRLNHLDLFYNPLTTEDSIFYEGIRDISSLVVLSASIVAASGTKYTAEDLPYDLLPLIAAIDFCNCGKPTLPSVRYSIYTRAVAEIASTVILPLGLSHIPIKVKLCSPRCNLNKRFLLLR